MMELEQSEIFQESDPMRTDSANGHIVLHPADNVGVAREELNIGSLVVHDSESFEISDLVRLGHKFALRNIEPGESIVKYGQVIGIATRAIRAGGWVHSHNLANQELDRGYEKATAISPPPPQISDRTFQGFRRADGRAGTRNYVAVISTVNCSASVAKAVARRFDPSKIAEYEQIDGVIGFTHESGCGMPFRGESHKMLNRVLAGIATHPNIGAYLLIGLGCEQNTMGVLAGDHGLVQLKTPESVTRKQDSRSAPMFTMQDQGGTKATIEAACRAIEELLPLANDVQREPIPASELVLATECGGSDGYSGITANPAVGIAADRIVACGGTSILAETTEASGAEHLLTRRARSPEVADRLLERLEWWRWYAGLFGAELDNNPSPGNKEGGLTTIAEKSLGAIAKGGSTTLEEVYQYAEPVTKKGFVFMDTPGYDPPSVTGMVAGGANVVVFTTGRGSCFGCKPSPSIKVATNTPMYERMSADMDINAGTILDGETVETVGEQIFERILEVASGAKTKSEAQGIGDEEFVPWTIGPVL